MDNQLYRQVMDLYRTRQEANWRIEQQRKDEVFAAHPDIAALAAHRHDLILKGVASIFQQVPQGDLETLMAQRAIARAKRFGEISKFFPVTICSPTLSV